MAQRGDIPAAKVASQWRFMRSLVREWLVAQMQTLPAGRLDEVVLREDSLLPLHEMIRPELMSLDIKPGPKDAVLRQIVAPLVQTGFAADPSRLLGNLLERERMMTTAIGHGVALPHPRKPIAGMFPEPAIALGICPDGTDFEAIDDQMVQFRKRLDRIVGRNQPVEFPAMERISGPRFFNRSTRLNVGEHRVPRPTVVLAMSQVERLAD